MTEPPRGRRLDELPAALRREVLRWRDQARVRPARIETPRAGQESVWAYPRPPRVEPVEARVCVEHAGVRLAESERALRVVETGGAPVYYVPPPDVRVPLVASGRRALCEWKGVARYLSLRRDDLALDDAAFCYPDPFEGYEAIRDFVAFLPRRVDTCRVGDARAAPQPGDYYAGWVTPDLAGPFKGAPGSEDW